jgi:hypothetical protein
MSLFGANVVIRGLERPFQVWTLLSKLRQAQFTRTSIKAVPNTISHRHVMTCQREGQNLINVEGCGVRDPIEDPYSSRKAHIESEQSLRAINMKFIH